MRGKLNRWRARGGEISAKTGTDPSERSETGLYLLLQAVMGGDGEQKQGLTQASEARRVCTCFCGRRDQKQHNKKRTRPKCVWEKWDTATCLQQEWQSPFFPGTACLCRGTEGLCRGTDDLCRGTDDLCQGTPDMFQGTEGLCQGTPDLFQGTEGLCQATSALYQGTSDLCQGTGDLFQGTEDLFQGTEDLFQGTEDLFQGTGGVCQGTNALLYPLRGRYHRSYEPVISREFLYKLYVIQY